MITKSPVTTNLKIEQLPNPLLSNKYRKDGSSELVDGDSFIVAFLFCIVAVINVGNAFLFLPFSYQRN